MRRRITITTVCLVLGAVVNVLVAWGCALWSPVHHSKLQHVEYRPPQSWQDRRDRFDVHKELQKQYDSVAWQSTSLRWYGASADGWPDPDSQTTSVGWGVKHIHQSGRIRARRPQPRLENGQKFFTGFSMTLPWDLNSASSFESGWPMKSLVFHRLEGWVNLSELNPDGEHFVQTGGVSVEVAGLRTPGGGINARGRYGLIFGRRLPDTPIVLGAFVNTLFYGSLALSVFFAPGAIKRHRRRKSGRCLRCGYDRGGLPDAHSPCPECGNTA